MIYVIIFFVLGIAGGAAVAVIVMAERIRRLRGREDAVQVLETKARETSAALKAKEHDLDQRHIQAEAQRQSWEAEVKKWLEAKEEEFRKRLAAVSAQQTEIDNRNVAYSEMQYENSLLKRDLRNLELSQRKLRLDGEKQRLTQEEIDQRSKELADRYLKESIKWIGSSLTSNNFVASKQRLLDVIERCRDIGFKVPDTMQENYVADLKTEFEKMVRAEFEREEQARIKAQIREEQQLQRETDRELKQLERERSRNQGGT